MNNQEDDDIDINNNENINNNEKSSEPKPAISQPQESVQADTKHNCDYCGTKLNPRFYYCLQCSRPYKHFHTTLAREKPLQLTGDELILKTAPEVWTLFWSFAGALIASIFVANMLFDENSADLQLYISDFFLLIVTLIFAAKYWSTLSPQFKKVGFNKWYAWFGLIALAPLLGLNHIFHLGAQEFFNMGEGSDVFSGLRETEASELTMVFFFCIFPAIIEEISFRGLMQPWLKKAIGSKYAILLASALFAAMHGNPISFFYLFLVGLVLGLVKHKTKSLYPPILLHFLHNFVVIKYMH